MFLTLEKLLLQARSKCEHLYFVMVSMNLFPWSHTTMPSYPRTATVLTFPAAEIVPGPMSSSTFLLAPLSPHPFLVPDQKASE